MFDHRFRLRSGLRNLSESVRIRHVISSVFEQFLAGVIADLSGQPAEAVAHDLLGGRRFTPDEAVAYGLADRTGEHLDEG